MAFLPLKLIFTIQVNLKSLIIAANLKLKLRGIEKILRSWTVSDQPISVQSEEHKHILCCSSKNQNSILRRVKIFCPNKAFLLDDHREDAPHFIKSSNVQWKFLFAFSKSDLKSVLLRSRINVINVDLAKPIYMLQKPHKLDRICSFLGFCRI